jgi:hypothetical protein
MDICARYLRSNTPAARDPRLKRCVACALGLSQRSFAGDGCWQVHACVFGLETSPLVGCAYEADDGSPALPGQSAGLARDERDEGCIWAHHSARNAAKGAHSLVNHGELCEKFPVCQLQAGEVGETCT